MSRDDQLHLRDPRGFLQGLGVDTGEIDRIAQQLFDSGMNTPSPQRHALDAIIKLVRSQVQSSWEEHIGHPRDC